MTLSDTGKLQLEFPKPAEATAEFDVCGTLVISIRLAAGKRTHLAPEQFALDKILYESRDIKWDTLRPAELVPQPKSTPNVPLRIAR